MTNAQPQKEKIGLREIADAANVSTATVSRVLNGNSHVDPAIQEAVLAAATRLGVDISRRNKTTALAFLLSNRAMLHSFHSRILAGAQAHCAAHGWDMVFLTFNYSPHVPWKELQLPKVLQNQDMVRAIVLAGTNSTNLLELLVHKGVNFAVLGNNVLGDVGDLKDHDSVFSDDVQGGEDMTRHLISLGHTEIGFVGNTRLPWFSRCFTGYARAMDEAGLPQRLNSPNSEDDAESGYLGTKSLLAQHRGITAILAGNDPTAHGVYRTLLESGLKIPDDISVAGCNDTVGPWLNPPLTTTREFPEQLGKQLVELVLNRVAKPTLPPQSVVIPTELLRRDSCRSPSFSLDGISPESLLELSTTK
jgi:DNA-binding LacI/PurR family transcriptional regulator